MAALHHKTCFANSKSRDNVGAGGAVIVDPHKHQRYLARKITEALDPTTAPSRCRTLAEMTSDERAALELRFGAKVAGREES